MVDEDYKVLWASVGGNGTASDAGIINECSLRATLVGNTTRFHPAEPLPKEYRSIPYFIPGALTMADEAVFDERADT